MRRLGAAGALVLFLALTLGACGGGDEAVTQPPPTVSPEQAALLKAQAQWQAQAGPAASYQFTLVTACYCLPEGPITIEVANGSITQAYDADTLQPVSASRRATLPTLADLHAKVQTAYTTQAAQVDVTFHPTLGYVQTLYIDADRRIADEEIGYTVHSVLLPANGQYSPTVAKYTGARQCEGGGQSVASMQAELEAASNTVARAVCGHDGMAYPAVCGASTGDLGVFELQPTAQPPRLPKGFFLLSQRPDAAVVACRTVP